MVKVKVRPVLSVKHYRTKLRPKIRRRAVCVLVVVSLLALIAPEANGQGFPFERRAFVPDGNKEVVTTDNANNDFQAFENLSPAATHLGAKDGIKIQGKQFSIEKTRPHETSDKMFLERYELHRPGAAWVKFIFKKFNLDGSVLTLSTPGSSNVQTFRSTDELRAWDWQSRMIIGGDVTIDLTVPSNRPRPPEVETLIAEEILGKSFVPLRRSGDEQAAGADEEAICGVDNRVLSKNPLVGRIIPVGCTAFIVEGDIYVSAGHCFRENRDLQEIEFNVPASSQTGMPRSASEEDTYKVDPTSILCNNCGDKQLEYGQDWSVFLVKKNVRTMKTPIEAQKGSYKILEGNILQGNKVGRVRIYGFGYSDKPLTSMYANQMADGTLLELSSNPAGNDAKIKHLVTTERGNSGSPVVALINGNADTDFAVGIHNGGKCNPDTENFNKGTSFSNVELLEAIKVTRARRPQ